MKNGLSLLLCLLIGVTGFSQNRKEARLYQLLEQKNYDKLQKKAKKVLSSDRKNIHANYVMAEYYIVRFHSAKRESNKKSNVSKALRYWKNVPIEANEIFASLNDSLHSLISLMASDSGLKTNINNQYRNWLLVYFNDSVPEFKVNSIPKILILDSLKIGDSLRYAMLNMAKDLEGVKYKWAGTSPKMGFDCSGFTQYVYKQVGIIIPHNAQMQSDLSKNRTDLNQLKPGDLVFFGSWNGQKQRTIHAGIIFGKEGEEITVIHCVNGGVKIEGKESSWDRYWINYVLFGISMDQLASFDE